MYTYTNKLLVIWPPFQSPLVRMVDPSGPHAKSKRLLAPGPSFGFDRSQHLAKSDEDFIRFRSILWWFRNRGGWLHSDILLLAAFEEFNRWTQWKRRRSKNRFEEPRTSGVRRAGGAKSHQTNSEQSFSCLHLRKRKWKRKKERNAGRCGGQVLRPAECYVRAAAQGFRAGDRQWSAYFEVQWWQQALLRIRWSAVGESLLLLLRRVSSAQDIGIFWGGSSTFALNYVSLMWCDVMCWHGIGCMHV